MDFVLGFQEHFLLAVFTGADGFVDQAGSFHLRGADFPFGNLLAVDHADDETHSQTNQDPNDDKKDILQFHKLAAHLLLVKMGAEGVGAYDPCEIVQDNEPGKTRQLKKQNASNGRKTHTPAETPDTQ